MATKYIFVDLDETLFHSRFLGTNPYKARNALKHESEKLIKIMGRFEEENEFYGSLLRPGALDLLASLRAIPDSKVMVLTASTEDYAKANNLAHALSFNPADIYHRASMQSDTVPNLGISDPVQAQFYLIDNLERGENRIKIRWIQNLADDAYANYIKVPEFFTLGDRFLDESLIAEIRLAIDILGTS